MLTKSIALYQRNLSFSTWHIVQPPSIEYNNHEIIEMNNMACLVILYWSLLLNKYTDNGALFLFQDQNLCYGTSLPTFEEVYDWVWRIIRCISSFWKGGKLSVCRRSPQDVALWNSGGRGACICQFSFFFIIPSGIVICCSIFEYCF